MQAILYIETGERAGETASVNPGETKVVGSGADAHVRLADPGVQPAHAALMVGPSGFQVVDLVGATFLNGEPIPVRQPVAARTNDELSVGEVALRVELIGVDAGAPAPPPRPQGPVLPEGEFEVQGELGRGAMGVVYQAVRRADRLPVAIKVMLEPVAEGSEAHRRFVTEGMIGQRINSPHVVQVYDVRVHGDSAFIVMEWVQGPCAWDLVNQGRLGAADSLKIAAHVALALAAAAAIGVVHRDVKPENILVGPYGIAKLSDFGIAKDLDSTMRSLTQSGVGLGTMAYMAPEAVSHAKHVDTSADLYSLGATLYHFLGGRPPFRVKTPEHLIHVLQDVPPPITHLVPKCPPDLAALIGRLLEKNPYDRPPRAADVAQELMAIRAREFGG
jgi:serine/threonine protein kinase